MVRQFPALLIIIALAVAASTQPGIYSTLTTQGRRLPPDWTGHTAPAPTGCHGGPCGGMAHYPTGPGIVYEAVFDVPSMPKEHDGICYYIYFNIFFSGKGHGMMNQFVPQLMLGNSLTTSTGPPDYTPEWVQHSSWVFSSQYFMEINNTATGNPAEAHAATGDVYPTRAGEQLWTRFSMSEDYVWTLGMGVVDDPSRTSTVISEQPFMGLVLDDTSSWAEEEYATCNVNTCWELYGVTDQDHFPSSGSHYDITISSRQDPFPGMWLEKWNPLLEDGGCANCTMTETHNTTTQDVTWTVEPAVLQ